MTNLLNIDNLNNLERKILQSKSDSMLDYSRKITNEDLVEICLSIKGYESSYSKLFILPKHVSGSILEKFKSSIIKINNYFLINKDEYIDDLFLAGYMFPMDILGVFLSKDNNVHAHLFDGRSMRIDFKERNIDINIEDKRLLSMTFLGNKSRLVYNIIKND